MNTAAPTSSTGDEKPNYVEEVVVVANKITGDGGGGPRTYISIDIQGSSGSFFGRVLGLAGDAIDWIFTFDVNDMDKDGDRDATDIAQHYDQVAGDALRNWRIDQWLGYSRAADFYELVGGIADNLQGDWNGLSAERQPANPNPTIYSMEEAFIA